MKYIFYFCRMTGVTIGEFRLWQCPQINLKVGILYHFFGGDWKMINFQMLQGFRAVFLFT